MTGIAFTPRTAVPQHDPRDMPIQPVGARAYGHHRF